jgi:hypothetical protein
MDKKSQVFILPNTSELKRVRLTKIKDNRFEGNHPNGVNTGAVREGFLIQAPKVGLSCMTDNFLTSMVTKILDDNTFETFNSTYKIEYL